MHGSIAQLVEQRIENPRVAGSIPARATFCNLYKIKVCSDKVVVFSVRWLNAWTLLGRYKKCGRYGRKKPALGSSEDGFASRE